MISAGETINRIYELADVGQISTAIADEESIRQFCRAHRAFQLTANLNQDDALLKEAVTLSGRFRFNVLSAPLPLNHYALIDEATSGVLLRRIAAVGRSYGELKPAGDRMTAAFNAIRANNANPLFDAIQADLARQPNSKIGFVIKASRLVSSVQKVFESKFANFRVVTETQLRDREVFECLYVFGAGRWYSGFVFSCPRAPIIGIVRYSFLADRPSDEVSFIQLLKPVTRLPIIEQSPGDDRDDFQQIEADEVVPVFDIGAVIERANALGNRGVDRTDLSQLVQAKALFLEQQVAVLVPALENATELVIDLGEEAEKLVRRVPVDELEPGMAVLVRGQGGGDYIVPAADQIMAEPLGN
jgi:hypothetical protein